MEKMLLLPHFFYKMVLREGSTPAQTKQAW
jgi:hypothetical protein